MAQSLAGQNLKYLRKLRGWTQEEFANKLGIKRSLVGAYEEERADPSEVKGNYLAKRRQQKLMSENNLIHFVPVKAAAGYLAGYADTEFIDELNTFTLPMLAGGNYRAFEIIGDSMLPTPSGSVIVGEKIHNLDDAKSSNAFIVISRNEGIVYKRIEKSNRNKSKVTLVSDNPSYQPYQVNSEDILELWQAQMVIAKVASQQRWDVNQLASLVSNLQEQVTVLKKKYN